MVCVIVPMEDLWDDDSDDGFIPYIKVSFDDDPEVNIDEWFVPEDDPKRHRSISRNKGLLRDKERYWKMQAEKQK